MKTASITLITFLLFLTALNLTQALQPKTQPIAPKTVLGESTNIPETQYWEDIIKDYPNYLPAYLELINLNLNSGNLDQAKNLMIKAKALNPNSEELKNLELRINH